MRFVLDIELGNEAMQSSEDVADALRRVAAKVEALAGEDLRMLTGAAPINDRNGNRVGTYRLAHTCITRDVT